MLNDPLAADAALAQGPEVWQALLESERAKALAAVLEDATWAAGRATLQAHGGATDDKGEIARLACLRAMDSFEAGEFATALEQVKSFTTNVGRQGNWPRGGLDEVKAALKTIKQLVRDACEVDGRVMLAWDLVDDELARLMPLLREAFGTVSSHLEAARRRERKLDFTALEVHALRALSHDEVVEFYARRWRAILVDEFQDTNPVQARLLERLSAAAQLTVVGDEKQAIYGFRGADVTVFRRYRDELKSAGGGEIELSRSFRSHSGLIAAFDGVFPTLMGDLHKSLDAAREAAPGSGPYVSVHTVEVSKGRARKAAKRLTEAHAIAALISRLVADRTPVWDPETGDERPVRFGDIALLARGKAPFETYAQVLPALGVPAINTGGGNLLETREAKDGVAALRFFADPHDDVALAAVLRGPFFALDDRRLLEFAGTVERGASWWSTLLATEEADWQRPRQVLSAVLDSKWTSPPSLVLQALDEATGYGAVVANLSAGLRRLADWRGFLGLVRKLEADQSDAFAVSRRLRRLLLAEVEVPRPTLQARDAVALMTIHKSKGLEWPVVVVADLSYEGGGGGRELFVDREHGLSLKLSDEAGETREPILHRLLKLRAKAREVDESRRLFYVAFTRARDRLILTSSEPGKGPLKFLEPALAAGKVPSTSVEHDPTLVFPDAPPPEPSEFGLSLDGDLVPAGGV